MTTTNTTLITYEELAAMKDRAYYSGFAKGVEIERQNEIKRREEAAAQVIEVLEKNNEK